MSSPLSSSLSCVLRPALASVLMAMALHAQAAPLLLTFDDLPGVDYTPGTIVTPPSQLRDQFLSTHGVRFSSGSSFAALVHLGLGHAVSGAIGVAATTPEGRLTYDRHELRVTFFQTANGEAGVTDFFSWTTDRGGDNRIVTLTAYGIDGQQLAQRSWLDIGSAELSLSVPGMHSVAFTGSGSAALDNLRFNAPGSPVPEQGTAALLAAGLAALRIWRQRSLA